MNVLFEFLVIKESSIGVRSQPDLRGIIPSSFAHIFDSISQSKSRQFLVRASYLEIYNVDIFIFGIEDKEKNEILSRKVFVIFYLEIKTNVYNYKNIQKKASMFTISVRS